MGYGEVSGYGIPPAVIVYGAGVQLRAMAASAGYLSATRYTGTFYVNGVTQGDTGLIASGNPVFGAYAVQQLFAGDLVRATVTLYDGRTSPMSSALAAS